MTRLLVYVTVGSAIGGAARLLLGMFLQQRTGASFPVGTLAVNITGSFLLGFLVRYSIASPAITPELRALLTTGICGGYTTFSTFSFETATLIEDARYERASIYILLSVGLALIGTFLGFAAARTFMTYRAGA